MEKKKKVSYSQFSKWVKCSHWWKLDYIDGLRSFEDSINTCFGTAIHTTLQTYLKSLYTEGFEVSDNIDLYGLFEKEFKNELNEKLKDDKGNPTYTEDKYKEFLYDGHDILDTFLNSSNRLKYFPSNKYEFIGVEIPVEMEIKNNVMFLAYVDLILKEKSTGKYKIFDLKTSTMGWNKYEKENETKLSQVLLYKAFYSKRFDVPMDKIDVEFFILKRKLYENVSFPQSRIQRVVPAQNKPAVAKSLNNFTEFLDECFNEDGSYKTDKEYLKNPGKGYKNCKWCSHYKKICFPTKKDIE